VLCSVLCLDDGKTDMIAYRNVEFFQVNSGIVSLVSLIVHGHSTQMRLAGEARNSPLLEQGTYSDPQASRIHARFAKRSLRN
jgi:hypothetical protein